MESEAEKEDERGRGRKVDIIGVVHQLHKKIMKMWANEIKSITGSRYPVSYQKYRVLLAVAAGNRYSYDIIEHADVLNTVGQEMLDDLHKKKWLTRESPDKRTYLWGPTNEGLIALARLDSIVIMVEKMIADEAKHVIEGASKGRRP